MEGKTAIPESGVMLSQNFWQTNKTFNKQIVIAIYLQRAGMLYL